MSKIIVTEHVDGLSNTSAEKPLNVRTVHVSHEDEGFFTFRVRPWSGSVEISAQEQMIQIDTFAVPALIKALKAAHKEASA